MKAVVGLLLAVFGVSHGGETYCDGRQSGAQCYGALGGTVIIRLMDNASEIFRYDWKNEHSVILNGRQNVFRVNIIQDRSLFVPSDGTFRINDLRVADSGEYTLQIYDSLGSQLGEHTLHLSIPGGETYCDCRQSGAQCYGALGGTVVIRLMDSTAGISRFLWKKEASVILSGTQNSVLFSTIQDRSLFIPSDGTISFNALRRSDSDQYTLELYDSNGLKSREQTLQLSVQAPVSSVRLVSECLSHGEKRVSCSSDGGDSPQYSWTLDGHSVTDAELLSGNNETNIITLKQHVSGHLVCSVRNHISSVSREEMISTCGFIFIYCTLPNGTHISEWVFEANNTLCIKPATEDSLVLCALKAAVVILLLIGIPVYFAWKKKKQRIDEDSAVPQTLKSSENSVMMVETNT